MPACSSLLSQTKGRFKNRSKKKGLKTAIAPWERALPLFKQ